MAKGEDLEEHWGKQSQAWLKFPVCKTGQRNDDAIQFDVSDGEGQVESPKHGVWLGFTNQYSTQLILEYLPEA